MPAQFSDFYNSLDPDPLKRGKQFEHFVKWFLKADPEWATQVDQVWLWDEWPGRWGADCGIDLVFQHRNGEHWAVQAKCYSPDYDITKHDVDKFLSESNRPSIQHRLLIATTDRIGANAKQVCDAQEKPVVRFLLSDFDKSALDYPANFAALPQAKRKPRPTPKEHQLEAIEAVVKGLKTADRGQLIMACGTGKTYTTLWIKEKLVRQQPLNANNPLEPNPLQLPLVRGRAEPAPPLTRGGWEGFEHNGQYGTNTAESIGATRTLVLLPSLGLLAQTLREWTFAAATPFEVLCVCSDQTVGSKGSDEAIHSVADLAFPVTSDAEEVKRFLGGAGNRVVFSTYQSSSVIAAAQADPAIPAFDLVVADEAHRCAGKVGSDFTAILDNAQIRSAKRLFATATPRTYSSTVHKAAEDRGVEVVGMDNAALFGEVLYALPFGKAIERKLLTDYRVVIIGVDDPTIAQWIANRDLVTTGTGIETDSESLAAQIGLLKAIKDYDLKRIISFHSRVKRAEAFTTDMQNTMQWISDEHRPSGTLRTDFVSGNMSANKRKIKLDQLKALSADERGVLSNARCLSEGVDVPSLDGVAFIDPRSSQVDIIQAVGRAIRLSPNKKAGTIVLPVFIAAGQNAEDTIEASHFKPVWDVLNALKAHDDVLACELDQIRTEMGRKPGIGVSAGGLGKISIDLPITVDHNFGSVLRTCLVERVTDSWEGWFGKLLAYRERFDHCNVVQGDDEYRSLGSWVAAQRTQNVKGTLSKERIEKLNAISFIWGLQQQQKTDDTWMKWYRELEKYTHENGNPNVNSRDSNTKLASWVWTQRIRRGQAYGGQPQLTDEQVNLLDKLGFSWDARDSAWMAQLEKLKEFKRKFGHCNVELERDSYDFLLKWLSKQRALKKEGQLQAERVAMLDELGVAWDGVAVWDAKWREMYEQLKKFHAENGNLDVPKICNGNRQFSAWIHRQRTQRMKNALSDEQVGLLNEIGFTWKHRDRDSWDARLAEVVAFKEKHGHCNIPIRITDPPKLGAFINATRSQRNKGTLSAERIAKLDEVGFVWRQGQSTKIGEDGMNEVWKHCFDELVQYKHQHGDFNVPYKFSENPKLSWWVRTQRKLYRNGNLHSERIRLLEAIGFEWESEGAMQPWEVRYAELLSFKKTHGNCDVAVKYQDNPSLGVWVVSQRSKKKLGKLTIEQERLLNKIGFIWEKKKRVKSA